MSVPAWRASLRIARREAWKAKSRSLLVIALIGLPVLVLACADIAYRTWQLNPHEKITRTIGSADAAVRWGGGGTIQQDPKSFSSNDAGSASSAPTPASVVAKFPPGSREIRWRQSFGTILTKIGAKNAEIDGLDYADPLARGLVKPVSGRAPRTVHEIAFTRSLARDTGYRLGDTVQMSHSKGTFVLVGIVADATYRQAATAYVLPAAVPRQAENAFNEEWLLDTPAPVTWQQVLDLNRAGYLVVSRDVYLNPPPKSQVLYHPSGAQGIVNAKTAVTTALIAGMALLEVILLAGPAFAVSARRQRRDLALIAAIGGRRRDLRNVVLSNGVVLGLAGGLLSAITAIGVAAIGIAAFGHYINEMPGHFDVRPLELLALTLVSLLTALAAAVFPARGAARTDVVAALAGRRGTMRTRKRVPLLGVIIAGAGAVVALAASGASADSTVILTGVALTEIGLIICTPALLGLVSRAGRWVPLSARLALRDAGRNRSSAAPAVAAVMAAVIGSVALAIGVASSTDQDRRAYQPRLPMNDAFVWADPAAKTEPQVIDALRTALPGARVVPVRTPPSYCEKAPCSKVVVPPGEQSQYSYLGSGDIPPVVIDDGSTAETLLQTTSPEAVAALHAGKVVVTDPSAIHQGRTTLTLYDVTAADSTPDGSSGTSQDDGKKVTVPAVAVPKADAFVKLVIPPSLATQLGVRGEAGGIYARTSHRPTEHEVQAANGALARIDQNSQMEVETGYHNPQEWMLLALLLASAVITLGAALIATALSNVDNRSDLTTLGAVGAAPRTRRLLSMSRAGVIAGIGTLLGVVAGFLPSFAWVHSQRSFDLAALSSINNGSAARMHFVIPWLPLLVTVIVVPTVATLIAGLVSRSRLPSERPAD